MQVRPGHPLRSIREIVDQALVVLGRDFEAFHSPLGRSIPPEKLLRAMLLRALYPIRLEGLVMERLEYDSLFRWFVGTDLSSYHFSVDVAFRNGIPTLN